MITALRKIKQVDVIASTGEVLRKGRWGGAIWADTWVTRNQSREDLRQVRSRKGGLAQRPWGKHRSGAFVSLTCAEYEVCSKARPRKKAAPDERTLLAAIRNLDFIFRGTEDTRGLKTRKELRRVATKCEVYILKRLLKWMCEVRISGASEQKQGNQSGNNYSTTGKRWWRLGFG